MATLPKTARETVLRVRDLEVEFRTDDGIVRAVRGVSFDLKAGETLGIVGESGSGKSVMNLALLGLIPQPPGRVVAGEAWLGDENLLTLPESRLNVIRGNRVAMIFQDPMTSLNPFLTIGAQLREVTMLHLGHSRREATDHAVEMLGRVGIASPLRRINDYPHEFSGGMRQRVMIAMALSCKPEVLIADEPTTALDVTIQAQILELMHELQSEQGTAIILITHDLGIVANLCHRVHVMYAGRFVEEAPVEALFATPRHPYTLGLLKSVPRLDEASSSVLTPIAGQPPDLTRLDAGCAFRPRCEFAADECASTDPPLVEIGGGRRHACLVELPASAAPGGSR